MYPFNMFGTVEEEDQYISYCQYTHSFCPDFAKTTLIANLGPKIETFLEWLLHCAMDVLLACISIYFHFVMRSYSGAETSAIVR